MKNPKFSLVFRAQKNKPNSVKSFKIVNLTILVLITSLILFSSTCISTEITSGHSPEQLEPKVTIELDVTEEKINTSASITEPIAQVEGEVKLESNLPLQISVNLTVSSLWNSTVIPHLFKLNITVQDHVSQDITITIKAPMGTEDETTQVVTIAGTYSYLSDITSQILEEEISPVQLTMTAENITTNQNGDNDNGNGKDDDDNGSPGFEGILLIASVMIIIFFIYFKKKRY